MAIDKHVSKFYNNDWFIYDGQEISGPVHFSNILEWFYTNDETQNQSYYVCQEGMSSWQRLKDTIDLHNKLQQFSVEEEKNKFIEQLESQLEKINKDIKDSLSSSSSLSSLSYKTDSFSSSNSKESKLDIEEDSFLSTDTLSNTSTTHNYVTNDTKTAYTSELRSTQDEYRDLNIDNLNYNDSDNDGSNYNDNDNTNDIDTSTRYSQEENESSEIVETSQLDDPSTQQPEHRTHQILKNQTKSRTYKKSLKVPPLSSDMELIILTNRLRLGKTRSLFLSSIVLPILTCGTYIIYWLIVTQIELTKFLNKKTSSILLLCSFLPVLNIFSIYHLLSLKNGLCTSTTDSSNHKRSRILQFISSSLLSLVLPIFIWSFQNTLNRRWKMIMESLQQKNTD